MERAEHLQADAVDPGRAPPAGGVDGRLVRTACRDDI